MAEEKKDICRTPRRKSCRIPVAVLCPAAPRKKAVSLKRKAPPKDGYFRPPDLEVLFGFVAPRGDVYVHNNL
ncbi:Cyclin-dependent protein kinase inhibitor SMR4, partial [Cucurbita argyrosperma subsp. argyrosperma]